MCIRDRINEILLYQTILQQHEIKCINGILYDIDRSIPNDEMEKKILNIIEHYWTSGISAKVTAILSGFKMYTRSDPLSIKEDIYEVNLFMQTSYIQREPSDVFQTLQQSSAEVSKEKIAHGMKETDPGVFASVLTESVQKSIDKNSYGDPVTVTVKVEKNHSGTYELSETERSKLETAMFPTE